MSGPFLFEILERTIDLFLLSLNSLVTRFGDNQILIGFRHVPDPNRIHRHIEEKVFHAPVTPGSLPWPVEHEEHVATLFVELTVFDRCLLPRGVGFEMALENCFLYPHVYSSRSISDGYWTVF